MSLYTVKILRVGYYIARNYSLDSLSSAWVHSAVLSEYSTMNPSCIRNKVPQELWLQVERSYMT